MISRAETTLVLRPGDNMNNCAQGYGCPNPTITLDPYIPFQNRYIDIGAGGPQPFTFTVTTNVSWIDLSLISGSISPSGPEQRVYVSVKDWSQVSGTEAAVVKHQCDVLWTTYAQRARHVYRQPYYPREQLYRWV